MFARMSAVVVAVTFTAVGCSGASDDAEPPVDSVAAAETETETEPEPEAESESDGETLEAQVEESGGVDEFVEAFVIGADGVVARDEAACVADLVFAAGMTPAEALQWAQDPLSSDQIPQAEFAACFDPATEISVPIAGALAVGTRDGLLSAGLSEEQADCVIAELQASDVDARDLFLYGNGIGDVAAVDAAFEASAVVCL